MILRATQRYRRQFFSKAFSLPSESAILQPCSREPLVEAGSPCIDEPLVKVESEKQKSEVGQSKIIAGNWKKKLSTVNKWVSNLVGRKPSLLHLAVFFSSPHPSP